MSVPLSQDGARQWQMQCFGCPQELHRAGIKKLIKETDFHGDRGAGPALGSILSDVQELIARPSEENLERARQYLNRVKDALFSAKPIEIKWYEE